MTVSDSTVAILLSTFNGAGYLREQLDSILEQTYADWVLLVRDDGSTDGTLEILDEYEQRDSRITTLRETNYGVVASFFRLMTAADGRCGYFAFCDQDDVWLPGKLERAIGVLETSGSAQSTMYCARQEYVDDRLGHLGYSPTAVRPGFMNAVIENVATGCTVVISREARDQILSRLPEHAVMHDWWCYLVVSCLGQVFFDDFIALRYRQHGGNQIGAAASSFGRLSRRIRRNLFAPSGMHKLVRQAEEFADLFGDEMPANYKTEVLRFIARDKNILERMRFSVCTKLRRSRGLDTFLFRVLFLLNRYSL